MTRKSIRVIGSEVTAATEDEVDAAPPTFDYTKAALLFAVPAADGRGVQAAELRVRGMSAHVAVSLFLTVACDLARAADMRPDIVTDLLHEELYGVGEAPAVADMEVSGGYL